MKKQRNIVGVLAVLAVVLVAAPFAAAASTAGSQLSQTIQPGVLSTDFRSSTNTVVASPSFGLSNVTSSTGSVGTATGTFGDSNQRISVDNATGDSGWNLAIAGTGSWSDGSGHSYPYNAATSADGQLTIDPSSGSITTVVGGGTGVAVGTSGTFSDTISSISLMSAAAGASDTWNGYLTGVDVSQTIPAGQAPGSYSLTLTQTVTTQ